MGKFAFAFFMTFSLCTFRAHSFDPVNAIPDSRFARNANIYFAFENDTFGFPAVSEWDDLRSFGLVTAVDIFPIGFEARYYTYTRRQAGEYPGLRDDELQAMATYSWDLPANRLAEIRFGISAGAIAVGDLNGLELQKMFHGKISKVERAVPETYASSSVRLESTVKCGLDFRSKILFFNISGYLSGQLDGFGRFGGNASLLLSANEQLPTLQIGILASKVLNSENIGVVFAAIQDAENGLWLFDTFASDIFEYRCLFNPISGISNGSVSVRFGKSNKKMGGSPRAIEVGCPLGHNAYQTRYRVHPDSRKSGGSTSITFFIDRSSGWSSEPSATFADNRAERFFSILAGIDLAVPFSFRILEPFACAGAGMRIDSTHDQPPGRATLLDVSVEPSVTFELGARILPIVTKQRARYGFSFSGCLQVLPVSGRLEPAASLRIVCEEGR